MASLEGQSTTPSRGRDDGGNEQQPISPTQLTRLVRFSMLQARRSNNNNNNNNNNNTKQTMQELTPPPKSTPPPSPSPPSSLPPTPLSTDSTSKRRSTTGPLTALLWETGYKHRSPVTSSTSVHHDFQADKERPSTEVPPYSHQHQDHQNWHPHQPPQGRKYSSTAAPPGITNDVDMSSQPSAELSASLTLSGASIDDEEYDHEDMHLLLAPDSGSIHDVSIVLRSHSSNGEYNSTEIYSSASPGTEYYDDDDVSHSSDVSEDSSDSIMRRVEEEIANARKASSDAQARLAYFTAKHQQQSRTPSGSGSSYSFDFESLGTSGDLHSLVGAGTGDDENFESALGVIGQEFNSSSPSKTIHSSPGTKDQQKQKVEQAPAAQLSPSQHQHHLPEQQVEEKVDIEIVLAPSAFKKSSPKKSSPRNSKKNSAKSNSTSPLNQQKSHKKPANELQRILNSLNSHGTNVSEPQESPSSRRTLDTSRPPLAKKVSRSSSDSVTQEPQHMQSGVMVMDQQAISTVFSETSIETLPAKEGITAVFSDKSIGSLPNQTGSGSQPGSFSYEEGRPHTTEGGLHHLPSRQQVQNYAQPPKPTLTIDTNNYVNEADPSRSPTSKYASPRDQNAPSYRERLENKLKILGSRFPSSATKGKLNNAEATNVIAKANATLQSNYSGEFGDETSGGRTSSVCPSSPKSSVSVGKAYDGLETKIRDLLARTLNSVADGQQLNGNDAANYALSSPSAELKVIKQLLEHGMRLEEQKKKQISEDMAVPEERKQDLALSPASKKYIPSSPMSSGTWETLELTAFSAAPFAIKSPDRVSEPEPLIGGSTNQEILDQLDSLSQVVNLKAKDPTKASKSRGTRDRSDGSAHSKIKQLLNHKGHASNAEQQQIAQREISSQDSKEGAPSSFDNRDGTVTKKRIAMEPMSTSDEEREPTSSSPPKNAGSAQPFARIDDENLDSPGKEPFSYETASQLQGGQSHTPSPKNGRDDAAGQANEKSKDPFGTRDQNSPDRQENAQSGLHAGASMQSTKQPMSPSENELPTGYKQHSPRVPLGPSRNRQARKIQFRDPYPTPKPCRKPRSTTEIKRDHMTKISAAERRIKYKEPKGDLKRLLTAAMDSSLPRRSNACGALKVISKVDKNKLTLVRTTGFLDALVFVAGADIFEEEFEVMEDARARAVSSLYNVSYIKENRFIVCSYSGLLEGLIKVIGDDHGEARMEACGVLAQLAKSPNCREYMARVDGLLSILAKILRGEVDPIDETVGAITEDATEDLPSSSHSEGTSVDSDDVTANTKPRLTGTNSLRQNCSIRKQKSEMYDQYLELAKLSCCAALIHISKQCSVLDLFCENEYLLESIVEVARDSESRLHGKCLEILCNVSRLPANDAVMTKFPGAVDTLLLSCKSKDMIDRVWALRTIQNLATDSASKAILATGSLLTVLINCVTSKDAEEQHAAMAALLNLSTDPSAVVPITSTKNVLATLVYLAHNSETTSEIRLMACNALATVGLWLQTVSGFGSIPEELQHVLLPSHKTSDWQSWD